MQLMRMTEDGPLQPTPLWHRGDLEEPALVREFLRESRIVRKGLDGSLAKARCSAQPCQLPLSLCSCSFAGLLLLSSHLLYIVHKAIVCAD